MYDIHDVTCISDAVFKEKRQKITPKSKLKQEFVAIISAYYDVSSMETPRIYHEDIFYQSKALYIPTLELHSHSIPDVIIHSH